MGFDGLTHPDQDQLRTIYEAFQKDDDMQKQLLGVMTVILLSLTPIPVHAQTPSIVIAQASDSIEVDAAAAKLEEELTVLRSQVTVMKQQVAELTKSLNSMSAMMDSMSTTMTKMKKSNRKG